MDIDLRALTAVEAANDSQRRVLVYKVVAGFGEDLQGRSFALWGLAFKPDTDEMREAPSRVCARAAAPWRGDPGVRPRWRWTKRGGCSATCQG
jgi:UDP-glucose 6-dehydrogenase